MSGPAASGCWQRWTGRSDWPGTSSFCCSRLGWLHAWRHHDSTPTEPSLTEIIELY
jgi:hypothetical protein